MFWARKAAQKREKQERREQYQRASSLHTEYEHRLYYESDPRETYGRYMPPESLREEGDR